MFQSGQLKLCTHAPCHSPTTTLSPDTVSQLVDPTISTQLQTSTSSETEHFYLSSIRNKLQVKGFSPDTIKLILSSWRERTKSQCQSAAKKWFEFRESNNCDMLSPPLPLALSFLSALHKSGLSYNSINTTRSVPSSILSWNDHQIPFGQLPIVKRFMKGVFESRPALPRYSSTWNVKDVITYIQKQANITLLTLKDLSHRVAFLLCLLSGQRCQTISKLSIDDVFIENLKITFVVTEILKHTSPGKHQQPLIFLACPNDKNLCIVSHLLEYIIRTSALRGENKQLLISFIRPLKPISTETTSLWVKSFMAAAGIKVILHEQLQRLILPPNILT